MSIISVSRLDSAEGRRSGPEQSSQLAMIGIVAWAGAPLDCGSWAGGCGVLAWPPPKNAWIEACAFSFPGIPLWVADGVEPRLLILARERVGEGVGGAPSWSPFSGFAFSCSRCCAV
jgi:hypothetical protein